MAIPIDSDGWPVGEKRYHCKNCAKSQEKAGGKFYPDPAKCPRLKRVGIGFCRDHSALHGGN